MHTSKQSTTHQAGLAEEAATWAEQSACRYQQALALALAIQAEVQRGGGRGVLGGNTAWKHRQIT